MLPATLTRRQFEGPFDMLREFDRAFNRLVNYEGDGGTPTWSYPVDVTEHEDHFIVEAELPGFKKDEIDISLEQGVLSITAERKAEEASGAQHVAERRYTKVARRFSLPSSVDPNNVDAKLNDGVLTLTIGKREEVKPRKINVG